jgi:shikimate dehydrogenase
MTRVLCLLGDPVRHSLSPRLHNNAMQEAGLDGVYVAIRTEPRGLPGLLRGIAWGGGAGNITLPFKTLAHDSVDDRTPAALRTGAVNTFWLEEGRIVGDNTDVAGFVVALGRLAGGARERSGPGRALLLGAGGAARAALAGLIDSGVPEIGVWNRTGARAEELVRAFRGPNQDLRRVDDPARWFREGGEEGPVLVVNATSVGLRPGDADPLPLSILPRNAWVLDLVYHPSETAWVRRARAMGFPAADGGDMLVAQGEAAYQRWWGEAPPEGSFHRTLESLRQESRDG